MLQHQSFQDRHVVLEEHVVGRQVLRVLQVDAGRVDADQPNSLRMQEFNKLRRERREILVPVFRIGECSSVDEDAFVGDRGKAVRLDPGLPVGGDPDDLTGADL